MATAVSQSQVLFDTTAGNKTTGSGLTYALDDLIVVVAANSGSSGQVALPTVTDDSPDGFGTTPGYAKIQEFTNGTSTFIGAIFIRKKLLGSTTAANVTEAGGTTTGGGLCVLRVTGMLRTGVIAARQSARQNNNGSGTTPAPSFGGSSAFNCLTGNTVISAVINLSNAAGMTVPSAWTSMTDVGYATPTSGLSVAAKNSGFTSNVVTWGSTSATGYGSIALELDASAVPTDRKANPGMNFADPGVLMKAWRQRIFVPRLWLPEGVVTA